MSSPCTVRVPLILVVSSVDDDRTSWRERLLREGVFAVDDFRSLAEALGALPDRFDAAVIELPIAHPVVLPWLGRLHARQPGALVIVRVPGSDEAVAQTFRAAGCTVVFAREEGRERTVAFLLAALAPERSATP